MGSLNTSELKKGVKLLFDNQPYVTLAVDFVKPGKGNAFYKIRVQNLITNNVLEKTIRSGESMESADVIDTDMEFLYRQAGEFVFMDSTTFEQVTVSANCVGDQHDLLMDNMSCVVTLWDGQPIAVRLPASMSVVVEYTEPAVKGDTQSRVMKEAVLSTGAKVQVPTFVGIGDKITINTESRQYTGRDNK